MTRNRCRDIVSPKSNVVLLSAASPQSDRQPSAGEPRRVYGAVDHPGRHHAARAITQPRKQEPGDRGEQHRSGHPHDGHGPRGPAARLDCPQPCQRGHDMPETKDQRRGSGRLRSRMMPAEQAQQCSPEDDLLREGGSDGDAKQHLVGHAQARRRGDSRLPVRAATAFQARSQSDRHRCRNAERGAHCRPVPHVSRQHALLPEPSAASPGQRRCSCRQRQVEDQAAPRATSINHRAPGQDSDGHRPFVSGEAEDEFRAGGADLHHGPKELRRNGVEPAPAPELVPARAQSLGHAQSRTRAAPTPRPGVVRHCTEGCRSRG
jgi:hypothetical protein